MTERIDWAVIKADFEAGMSLRQLETKYGVNFQKIHKYSKKYNWKKDLAPQIEQRAKRKLHEETIKQARKEKLLPEQPEYPDARPLTDDEVVEANADVTVRVVMGHRTQIGRAKEICAGMFEELGALTSMDLRDLIEEAIIEETKEADTGKGTAKAIARAKRNTMLGAISLPTRAGVMDKLSGSLKTLIQLEREAYGIKTEDAGQESVADALRRLSETPVPEAPTDGQ